MGADLTINDDEKRNQIAMDLGVGLDGNQIDVIVITWFKMRSTGAVVDPDRVSKNLKI